MSYHSDILNRLEDQRAELHRRYETENAVLLTRQRTIEAFIQGKSIEIKNIRPVCDINDQWRLITSPSWDFDKFNYRVAPEKKWGIVFRTPDGGMDVVHGFTTPQQSNHNTYRGQPIVTYFHYY